MNKILYESKQLQTWRWCEFLDQLQQIKHTRIVFFYVFTIIKWTSFDDDDDDDDDDDYDDDDDDDNNNNNRLTELLVSGRKEAFVSSALGSSFYYFWRRILIRRLYFHVCVASPPTWCFWFNIGSGITAESGSSTVTSLVVVVVVVVVVEVIINQFRELGLGHLMGVRISKWWLGVKEDTKF
jgi:hypothetical protein